MFLGLSADQIYYSKKVKIQYSECDLHNELQLSAIMHHIQQIGSEQLDSLGLFFQKLRDEKFVFLLSKEQFFIHRLPKAGETMCITTNPATPVGAQFERDVMFTGENGEPLITAYTSWLLVNPDTHKIYRPAAFPYPFPYVPTKSEKPVSSFKCRHPALMEKVGERPVRYTDLDCNAHVNNAVYGETALDFLPYEEISQRRLSSFYIQFVRETKYGQTLEILRGREEGCFYICGQAEDGLHFDVRLSLKNGGQGR